MTTPQSIVLASSNQGKIKELNHLLSPLGYQVRAQGEWQIEDAEETGLTFVENALIKARHAAQATGLPALADDSGLAVDALQGAPGIYSARYANSAKSAGCGASDADNIEKLLGALQGVEDTQRTARFICVLVYLTHPEDPTPLICQGQWEGRILHAPTGNGGFGYDPVFYVPERGCSSAELSKEEKSLFSHRAKALAQLRRLL